MHPSVPQLVGEPVRTHCASLDEEILCGDDVVRGERAAAGAPQRILEADLPAQDVHQPRMPGSQRIGAVHRRGLEVPTEQSLHFPTVEIA